MNAPLLAAPEQASSVTAALRPALVLLVVLSLVTGLAYPLAITGLARWTMPRQAGGSIVRAGGKEVGSALIGQAFSDPKHFWGRPSATAPGPNNASASGGSNLGPTNPALIDAVKGRVAALRAADPGNRSPVPVDLVTASASGLDPDLSVAGANYQVPRIARLRGLAPEKVEALVEAHVRGRWLGFLGEPRVNVLELNLALDAQP